MARGPPKDLPTASRAGASPWPQTIPSFGDRLQKPPVAQLPSWSYSLPPPAFPEASPLDAHYQTRSSQQVVPQKPGIFLMSPLP